MIRYLYVAFWIFVHTFCSAQSDFQQTLPAFEIHSVNGFSLKKNEWNQYKGIAFVFVCNHCPMAKLYWNRINELHKKYLSQGILVLCINPMDSVVYEEESKVEMMSKINQLHLTIPYVQDGDQQIAKMFQVEHTPESFVIIPNGNSWQVAYKGAIDDNAEHPELAETFLQNALQNVIDKKQISPKFTESYGCRVYYRK
jgi:alkyl hydroperoxide reductase subunit AhpC